MAAVSGKSIATATLAAATEDVVTLTAGGGGKSAEITNHGDDGVLYCRGDGTAATVAGDECTVVLAGERLAVGLTGDGTLSVIAAAAPTYTVAVLG